MNGAFVIRPTVDAFRLRVRGDGLVLEVGRIGPVIAPGGIGAEVERRAGEGAATIARVMPVRAVIVRGDVAIAGVVAWVMVSPIHGTVVTAPVVIVSGDGGRREKQGYD